MSIRWKSWAPLGVGAALLISPVPSGLGTDAWQWLPQLFDASILSDEATTPGQPNFTGAFVGMACQDMSGGRLAADFDWFEYVERPYRIEPVGPPDA